MRDKTEFYNILEGLEQQDYAEYSRLVGDFDFSRFVLKINHVQKAVEDDPTLLMIRVPQMISGFPPVLLSSPVRRTALEDFLTRKVSDEIDNLTRYNNEGISRRHLVMVKPEQKILPRTSMLVTEEFVEARIYLSLPGAGGKILGGVVKDVFFEDLTKLVNAALIFCNLDENELVRFVTLMENTDHIRQLLPTRGFVSFVGENARLERLEASDKPDFQTATPIQVSEDLVQSLEAPNGAVIRGLGIPQGLTLILGDDYSGRVELMAAISHGIYNHVPQDGREYVVTVPDAVSIPAEPGRSIQRLDVSSFIPALPKGKDPSKFTTASASPYESQVAGTLEALEVGARAMFFDESSSAGSFLANDPRLTAALPGTESRTLSLLSRSRQIVDELGVSIIVAGSSGVSGFIPLADTILRIDNHVIQDITDGAKQLDIAAAAPIASSPVLVNTQKARFIVPSSIDSSAGTVESFIRSEERETLAFGRSKINLEHVEQLADKYQTETIGRVLYYARLHYMDERRTIRELLDLVDRDLSTESLECLTRDLRGDLARPRRYEIAAVINRLRTLRINQGPAV